MAKPGPKPKQPALRIVSGKHNVTRHGSEGEIRQRAERSRKAFDKIQRPAHLKGHARKIWDDLIAKCWWLDQSRITSATAFCELWNEFRIAPMRFTAAKHGSMRAYMAELGLTDERNRGYENEDKDDEFFGNN
jgi:phage terminase small subunit